jgi:hypothetical protein
MNNTYTDHQFNLFKFSESRPTIKVPISKEAIEKAKKFLQKGDAHNAAIVMRGVREKLESFLSRMDNGKEGDRG